MRENNDQVMNSSSKRNQLIWLVVLMKSRRVKGQRSKVKGVSEEQMSIQTLALNLAMFEMKYKLRKFIEFWMLYTVYSSLFFKNSM